jgi:3-methyl-2-oxobutanoate hydroxymethyltransferase
MLSVYDFPFSRIASEAGIDALLVGDSLAMTALGHKDTVSVTVEEMLIHVKSVVRGATRPMVIADMPFMSYQVSLREAVYNAGRFLKEGGADAVKIEGGRRMADRVAAINDAGIPVFAHIGLTPQNASQLGGLRVQANTTESARMLIEDALILQEAGAAAVLIECVPAKIAKLVTERINVPTISYGAGPYCDGQGLVAADALGLLELFLPKFCKRYADLGTEAGSAMKRYRAEVLAGAFPGPEHCFDVSEEVDLALLRGVREAHP